MALFTTKGADPATRTRLARQQRQGRLRRLHEGVYTDDLVSPPEAIVRREILSLLAILVPEAVVSHRSALESGFSSAGDLFLTGPYRRRLALPGVTLRIGKGTAPLASDIRLNTPFGPTYRAAEPRAFLENLSPSRGAPGSRRTLGQAAVEARLERIVAIGGAESLNRVRDDAKRIAGGLSLEREASCLDAIIGALLGTREAALEHPLSRARAHGAPYDATRVDLFQGLATRLTTAPPVIPVARTGDDPRLVAFVESYFSNYIEGTEFEIDEAREVVLENRTIAYREDDSHDIRGTFDAIMDSGALAFPTSAAEFKTQLVAWNRQVIFARASKAPGEWKQKANRFGDTYFVAPELVQGTLDKGYEVIASTSDPAVRAALAMFVVAEVHPFSDGNGRTARLMMNLALSTAKLTRLIIPTVYRDDYFSALHALSHSPTDEPPFPRIEPYLVMLNRAAMFSQWLDCSSEARMLSALEASQALKHPTQGKLSLPRPAG